MSRLVYFSSVSENTRRFVDKLQIEASRIPLRSIDGQLHAAEPYVLVTPTYGGANGAGAVPKQVIRFLNHTGNRSLVRGVIAAGNTNFGSTYCLAGKIVARKCQVPHLYNFELMGTRDDVLRVRDGLEQLW
ncbi:MAG: class Ib ribonucleoside-diphosphate reductase assembly flavoprotein NrdI [Nakamurella sp.]